MAGRHPIIQCERSADVERQISQAEYMAGNLRSKFSHGGYVAGKHIPPIFGKEAGK